MIDREFIRKHLQDLARGSELLLCFFEHWLKTWFAPHFQDEVFEVWLPCCVAADEFFKGHRLWRGLMIVMVYTTALRHLGQLVWSSGCGWLGRLTWCKASPMGFHCTRWRRSILWLSRQFQISVPLNVALDQLSPWLFIFFLFSSFQSTQSIPWYDETLSLRITTENSTDLTYGWPPL